MIILFFFKVRARTRVGYGDNSSVVFELARGEISEPAVESIDINIVIVTCVSVVSIMGWLALCCLLTFVIQSQRNKSKKRQVVINPSRYINSAPYSHNYLLLFQE